MPELPAMSASVEEIERRMLSSTTSAPQPHAMHSSAPQMPSQPQAQPQPHMSAENFGQPMTSNVASFFAQFGEALQAPGQAPHAPGRSPFPPGSGPPPKSQKPPESFDAANFFAQFHKGSTDTSLPPMPSQAYAPTAWGGVQPTKPSS
jgi:hypothetical protein